MEPLAVSSGVSAEVPIRAGLSNSLGFGGALGDLEVMPPLSFVERIVVGFTVCSRFCVVLAMCLVWISKLSDSDVLISCLHALHS